MIIVAKDGSGDYQSIQEALDAVPGGGRSPTIILVRMNDYQESVTVSRDNIRIVGEARDRTVLQGRALSEGDSGPVMLVTGKNVEIENLTIRPLPQGEHAHAPLAVCAEGDRGVFRNCRLESGGTALRTGTGRQYFEDCQIEGGMECEAAAGGCWFERCTLKAVQQETCSEESFPENRTNGMVFHACTLSGWKERGDAFPPQAAFLDCTADAPEKDWQAHCLSEEDALMCSIAQTIGGYDGWRPDVRTPTWFLCGDSTMADYPPAASPMTGWGQALKALVPENIFVENCAVCGRSSKSFVAEKRLGFIELCLRKGDRLIVSFSHNDEKKDPLRFTSPERTFPEYLDMYLDAARAHGAEPVLVTPIARRHFGEDGQPLATHGRYPDAMRTLAMSRGVRLVDLEKATMELLRDLGEEGSRQFYCHVPAGHPNYPEGLSDNSHLHRKGAVRFASLFLELLRGAQTESAFAFESDRSDLSELISGEDRVLHRKEHGDK